MWGREKTSYRSKAVRTGDPWRGEQILHPAPVSRPVNSNFQVKGQILWQMVKHRAVISWWFWAACQALTKVAEEPTAVDGMNTPLPGRTWWDDCFPNEDDSIKSQLPPQAVSWQNQHWVAAAGFHQIVLISQPSWRVWSKGQKENWYPEWMSTSDLGKRWDEGGDSSPRTTTFGLLNTRDSAKWALSCSKSPAWSSWHQSNIPASPVANWKMLICKNTGSLCTHTNTNKCFASNVSPSSEPLCFKPLPHEVPLVPAPTQSLNDHLLSSFFMNRDFLVFFPGLPDDCTDWQVSG